MIFAGKTPDGNVGLTITDPDAEAQTGRWCQAPLMPDRCDKCFDPDTLAHYPAEGFREVIDPDGTVWRHGTYHRCCLPDKETG